MLHTFFAAQFPENLKSSWPFPWMCWPKTSAVRICIDTGRWVPNWESGHVSVIWGLQDGTPRVIYTIFINRIALIGNIEIQEVDPYPWNCNGAVSQGRDRSNDECKHGLLLNWDRQRSLSSAPREMPMPYENLEALMYTQHELDLGCSTNTFARH